MKLPIEVWLERQSFDLEAVSLFEESIICYKAGAYRAGLLFSYLGTQSVLKQRIFEADKPDNVTEFFWNEIAGGLLNDDKWESTVWLALESKKHGEIFKIGGGHLKNQLEYWKGIRNDCAHAKDNEILSAHVESYWAFLKSNLPKLVVLGGKDSIINRIERYFDERYTPKNADPAPIIVDMVSGVRSEDWNEVFSIVEGLTLDDLLFSFEVTEIKPSLFWKRVIEQKSVISRKCVEFLINSSNSTLYLILDIYPHLVSHLSNDPETVRGIWYEKITDFTKPFKVLASLLDNNCIPPEQTEEAITAVVLNSKDTHIDQFTLQRLNEYGFFRLFEDILFRGPDKLVQDFDWTKYHANTICCYIKYCALNKEIVNSISEAFATGFHPYKLGEKLTTLLNKDDILKARFENLAEEEGIILPERLGFRGASQ